MPPNERGRASRPDLSRIAADESTTTTLTGHVVTLRIEAVTLGRRLELDPTRWPDAQMAFRLATGLADVARSVARL